MDKEANHTIDAFGGTCAVAELCQVTTGAVSQWRTNGIPPARLMYLRLLRPELFADAAVHTPETQETERAA